MGLWLGLVNCRFGEGMAGVFGDDCKGGSLRVLVCGGEMKD